jgi:hypothetical protein
MAACLLHAMLQCNGVWPDSFDVWFMSAPLRMHLSMSCRSPRRAAASSWGQKLSVMVMASGEGGGMIRVETGGKIAFDGKIAFGAAGAAAGAAGAAGAGAAATAATAISSIQEASAALIPNISARLEMLLML